MEEGNEKYENKVNIDIWYRQGRGGWQTAEGKRGWSVIVFI